MRVPRIHTAHALSNAIELVLEPEASHHLTRVLRMGVGDAVTLFNGKGGEYASTIKAIARKTVTIKVGERQNNDRESPLAIHLGIAISRGERMDWIIQKATELGVSQISLLFTERVEVKLDADRAEKKLRHWQEVAINACEQCGRNRLPHLSLPQNMSGWFASTEAIRKFVLHHRASPLPDALGVPSSIALLVGPEGGLSAAEIEQAENNGYVALSLGPRVLRTETAPLAALAILQSKWGDMKTSA